MHVSLFSATGGGRGLASLKDGEKRSTPSPPTKHALRKKIKKEEPSFSSSSGSEDEEELEVGLLGSGRKRSTPRNSPSKRRNSSSSSFSSSSSEEEEEEERVVGLKLLSRSSRAHEDSHCSSKNGEVEEQHFGEGSGGNRVVGGEGEEMGEGGYSDMVEDEGQEVEDEDVEAAGDESLLGGVGE